MSVTFPDGVNAQGQGKLWYIPSMAGSAPTLAELTAGVDISCAIDGFSAPTEQGTGTDLRYCSTQQYEIPGRPQTTIDPINYVYDPQAPTSTTTYKPYSTLKAGVKGYLVNRLGLPYDTAAAAGQYVDIYPITCGAQARQAIDPSAEGSKIKITQKFFVTGPVSYDKAITA